MRKIVQLVIALLVGGCSAAPNGSSVAETPRAAAKAGSVCGGRLQRLNRAEIAELVVGARMRFAGDPGVCPGSVWVTSNWELEFRAGGDLRLQYDRADRTGRYAIIGDGLCITSGSRVDCHQLYRDERGRIYLAGAEVPKFLPAMVTIIR